MNMKKKINMTVGRFQPFTKGHLNMVNEGEAPCVVYQIAPPSMPDSIDKFKVKGKKVKKQQIENVLKFLNGEDVKLTEDEKEICKRPFTNELVSKELDIVKRNNKLIFDIVYVKNLFDAIGQFNKFCTDNKDKYEPQYLMCGDDRVDEYAKLIDKYDELAISIGSTETLPNILKGKLKTNVGKGRTEGLSGTAVRASIINNDKQGFERQMPNGVGIMFNDFVNAFHTFADKLQGLIKECRISLIEYIKESLEK